MEGGGWVDKNRGAAMEMIRGFQESGQSSRAERVDLQGGWEGRNVTRCRICTCSETKGTQERQGAMLWKAHWPVG